MNNVLKYLVISFIFIVFFIFSHIFFIFGIDFFYTFFGRGGYEGIKSSIVVIYGILFFIWLLIYYLSGNIKKDKIIYYLLIIIIGIFISTILSINIKGSILGLSEKFHGFIFYLSLILFFLSIYYGFNKKNYRVVLNTIFIFSIFIYLYGFIQFFSLDPLINLYKTRVPLTRASSFFGNANYLSGYIIILLPLSGFIINKYLKIIFVIISLLSLITTGSYLGIFIGFLYVLYLIFKYSKKISIFLLLVTIFFIFYFLVYFLGTQKFGSMLARPYIWKTTIMAILYSFKTFLFGYGPDTLHLVFDFFKVKELSIYETSYYTADRSHNLFLDLFFFFGIFTGGLITYFLFNALFIIKNINIKLSILFFILFFSFNIPVSIHFILILFLLSWGYTKKY